MNCTYCDHEIIEFEPGYGFYGDEPNEVTFHIECLELAEGAEVLL